MKITNLSKPRPLITLSSILGGGDSGPDGQVPTANGSNGVSWGSNVAIISAGGSPINGPFVNFAAGSNITLTIDQGPLASTPSNTIRIHATGGSASFGSNATAVAEISSGGASTDSARMDHYHAGIGTITASSSNTLQRGTFNLRSGNNISFGLTDTDGDGELDTVTINGAAGGGSGSLTVADEGTPLSTAATTLDFVGAGVVASGAGATKTITIAGGGAPAAPYSTNLEVWLDANDITSPPSDGSDLTTWDDKSGNGHDFTNSSNKPTYETNEVNGLPVVRFATNDVLEGGDLSASFPSAASAIIAFRFNVITTSTDLLEDASRDIWWNFGGTAYMGLWKGTRVASTATPVPTLGTHIVVVRSSSAFYEYWYDSFIRHSVTADFASGTVMHLGKGQNSSFIGDIMEVLLYDASIPDAGVAESVAYLRDKWGIPT